MNRDDHNLTTSQVGNCYVAFMAENHPDIDIMQHRYAFDQWLAETRAETIRWVTRGPLDEENILAFADRVENAVGSVLTNAMNFPEKVQAQLLGQDMSSLIDQVTDAVISIGEES